MPPAEFGLGSTSHDDAWRMFRIMAETVNGFEILNPVGRCVSIFGSARAGAGTPLYETTRAVARKLSEAGYGIITGGGPGLMEAGNRGATEGIGHSVGLHINLPNEQQCNEYVRTRCNFHYFFVRKFMFVKYAMAYVAMPGGMGTIDELSEAFVLCQTGRTKPFPIILYGSEFWSGLLDWLKSSMVNGGFIREEELDMLVVLDSPEAVLAHINKHVII